MSINDKIFKLLRVVFWQDWFCNVVVSYVLSNLWSFNFWHVQHLTTFSTKNLSRHFSLIDTFRILFRVHNISKYHIIHSKRTHFCTLLLHYWFYKTHIFRILCNGTYILNSKYASLCKTNSYILNHKHHYLFNKRPLENWLDNTQNIIDINYSTQQKQNNIFFERIDKTHGSMFAPSTLGLD